jgi:hypothetical protein
MRASLVVVSVLASTPARAQPEPVPVTPAEAPATTAVDPRIEKDMKVASTLARDGHCEVALEYGKSIEASAPMYYAQVFVVDPHIAACIAGTAPRPSVPAPSPPTTTTEPDLEHDIEPCRPATFYAAPSLFLMNGSTYSDGAGSSMMTSNEDAFHRIAIGAILRYCAGLPRFGARVGATAVANPNLSGFGGELEVDYGVRRLRGGLRLGVEYGSYSRVFSAGPRVHVYDTLFLGIDAYAARSDGYKSRGVMVGFGVEGRAGRWVVAIEGALLALGLVIVFAGGGPG